MKNDWMSTRRITNSVAFLLIALSLSTTPLVVGANVPATTVTIVNNSSREIRHLYLSPTNQENWGPDQLDPSTIGSGSSYTLSGISCSASDIKVIAEDQDGCFLYKTVTCGENVTWTIANDSARDCGN